MGALWCPMNNNGAYELLLASKSFFSEAPESLEWLPER